MQIERPKRINDAIAKLLSAGTVDDLKSDNGQMLSEFFTADEVAKSMDLPMGEVRDFNGRTCFACRGMYRFNSCPKCHGSFDNIDSEAKEIAELREVKQEESRVQAYKTYTPRWKRFLDRLTGKPQRWGVNNAGD